jgi:hypothetical protein
MTTTAKHGVQIPARGKVTRSTGDSVVFAPTGTNYELHLRVPSNRFDGPVGTPIEGVIRVQARKVYTVASGGNFLQPIFGPPRIIQGRVRAIEDGRIVVHAGAPIVVDLPAEPHAIDLNRGPITVGSMVNVVALPGAWVEF